MSLDVDRNTLNRLNRDIGDLRSKEAAEVRNEAEASKRANVANQQALKAGSLSSAKTYFAAAQRETKKSLSAQDRRARFSSEIAKKSQEAARISERILRAEDTERKSVQAADERRQREDEIARKALAKANLALRREYEARVAGLEAQLTAQIEGQAANVAPFEVQAALGESEPYDFFISHASSDKETFVDGFVAKATAAGLRVWDDRFSISWGDSIRQKIDLGFRNSYFGVVVLSPDFFSRPWTNYELDAIIQRDLSGDGRILPIWHRLTKDDVQQHAPSLVGRLALSTASLSSDAIVEELIRVRNQYKHAVKVTKS